MSDNIRKRPGGNGLKLRGVNKRMQPNGLIWRLLIRLPSKPHREFGLDLLRRLRPWAKGSYLALMRRFMFAGFPSA
jgi:hypothetical protein